MRDGRLAESLALELKNLESMSWYLRERLSSKVEEICIPDVERFRRAAEFARIAVENVMVELDRTSQLTE